MSPLPEGVRGAGQERASASRTSRVGAGPYGGEEAGKDCASWSVSRRRPRTADGGGRPQDERRASAAQRRLDLTEADSAAPSRLVPPTGDARQSLAAC
jgi:hypothetical protein